MHAEIQVSIGKSGGRKPQEYTCQCLIGALAMFSKSHILNFSRVLRGRSCSSLALKRRFYVNAHKGEVTVRWKEGSYGSGAQAPLLDNGNPSSLG